MSDTYNPSVVLSFLRFFFNMYPKKTKQNDDTNY